MSDDCPQLHERIEQASELLSRVEVMPQICGKQKLVKRLQAELRFLKKLCNSATVSLNHVKSSNLPHLSAIINCCSEMDGVIKILQPFDFYPLSEFNSIHKRIVIDVVCDNGRTWVKVVARNSAALISLSKGGGKFGQKDFREQVMSMNDCAKQNKYMYETPCIKVWFCGSFIEEVKNHLLDMNVEVLFSSEILGCNSSKSSISTAASVDSECLPCSEKNVLKHLQCTSDSIVNSSSIVCSLTLRSVTQDNILNLDISTMIAYVSNLTNGHANANFVDEILCLQASRELVLPVRNVLIDLFKGHKLICCSTACSKFKDIVSHIGGSAEKKRASLLLEQLEVVPDNPSDSAIRLKESSRIKPRAKIIFGTGDSYKAITVTANSGFLRAAEGQGVQFMAVLHEARALSEVKELSDSCLEISSVPLEAALHN